MESTSQSTAAPGPLKINAAAAVLRIGERMCAQLHNVLKRRGFVVAMSGGVDSSVCAGLAVRAIGAKRVFGLFMPERDSDPQSLELARSWAETLGIEYTIEDIAPTLEAVGCYRRRDEAIRRVVPEYGPGWKSKIALPGDRLNSDLLNIYRLVVQSPGGEVTTHRLPPVEYREIVASTNFKQRVRKMLEYHHADRLQYAVVGTPNRLEHDQGFFVKAGDGLADIKPIAHLYKTEVYQLATELGVPAAVTARAPTTDTYSLPQSQEEFYFSLPAQTMDLVLYAYNEGLDAESAAVALGYDTVQIERAYRDIAQKRASTRYLHLPPQFIEPVSGLERDDNG